MNPRPPGLSRRSVLGGLAAAAVSPLADVALRAAGKDLENYVPKAGEFPPAGAGVYLAGELVEVDHVNRRGAIRLVGDTDDGRYHSAPSHKFALLPYGAVRFHGAPADLRDVPIGTLLHGTFLLPPDGNKTVPVVNSKYVPKHSHALLLEDDVSLYRRQGRGWKVTALSLTYDGPARDGGWRKTPAHAGTLTAAPTGAGEGGLAGEQKFTVDRSTRIWRGRERVEWEDLGPADAWKSKESTRTLALNLGGAQLNLTWAPEWKNGQFHVADLWADAAAQDLAAEAQRRTHVRHLRHRWLPGWVDTVDHEPGGRGTVTVTLFGGPDQELLEHARSVAKKKQGAALGCAEWTLRTWWQEHDSKHGQVVGFTEAPNPPPGSSGLTVRVKLGELLDGYRPGRIVRVRPDGFPNVKLPPEERVKSLEEADRQ